MMIVFSSNLAKVNRVFVITNFRSNFHKSSFTLDSKNFKKSSSSETKDDSKLEKKILRERLAKKAFISLNDNKSNLSKREPRQQENKIIKKIDEVKAFEYTPSFKLKFSAQSSEESAQTTKKEELKQIASKDLNESVQKIEKLIEKDNIMQGKTGENFFGKFNPQEMLKNRKNIALGEPTIEQMNKNENDYLKLMRENFENFNKDEFSVKDGDVIIERPKQTKANFWAESPYNISQELTSGNGLSIFTDITSSSKSHESPLWSMHYDQELKHAQEIPPLNGFDELIKLTKQGKLWKFPIDNEQDIDETDAQIPFHEHVFLDHYLEEFPQIEPIQNFMTLALNGLSQNSFLSIKEKKEIIDWYKNYFNDRMDIIKEALDAERLEASYRESFENK